MAQANVEGVRERLRQVRFPGFSRDIVSFGFVRNVRIEDRKVTVEFAPDTRDTSKVAQMTAEIRSILETDGAFDAVEVDCVTPYPDEPVLGTAAVNPLQAELLAEGEAPGPDLLRAGLERVDIAPEAGYGARGPAPLEGPSTETYSGEIPVCQWEIDPDDENAEHDTALVTLGAWEYRLWWQAHPAGLVYASLHVTIPDRPAHGDIARPHPVGRAAAVNLVYDRKRRAIVAIYGTVRDFRPFVEAFRRGYLAREDPNREETLRTAGWIEA